MKRFLYPVLFLMFFVQPAFSQREAIKIQLGLVDTLIKKVNRYEAAIKVSITNTSDKNLFLPNFMVSFEDQINDTLSIYQNSTQIPFRQFSGYQGSTQAKIFERSWISNLAKQHYRSFILKKKFGDSLVSLSSSLRNRSNSNILFLAKGESFNWYLVPGADLRNFTVGDYTIQLKLKEKSLGNLPEVIEGYHKYAIDLHHADAGYIRVYSTNKGKRVKEISRSEMKGK